MAFSHNDDDDDLQPEEELKEVNPQWDPWSKTMEQILKGMLAIPPSPQDCRMFEKRLNFFGILNRPNDLICAQNKMRELLDKETRQALNASEELFLGMCMFNLLDKDERTRSDALRKPSVASASRQIAKNRFEKAKEKGCPYTSYLWGLMLLKNKNPSIQQEGVKLVTAAAEEGNPAAQFELGSICLNGNFGVPKDHSKAIHYLQKAADQGYPDALFLCIHFAPDDETIDHYLTQATRENQPNVLFGLANMAMEKNDEKKAAEYYRRSFENSYSDSDEARSSREFISRIQESEEKKYSNDMDPKIIFEVALILCQKTYQDDPDTSQ